MLHTKMYIKGGTNDLFIVIFVHPDVDVGRGGTFYNSSPVNTANKHMQESLKLLTFSKVIQSLLFHIAKNNLQAKYASQQCHWKLYKLLF